MSPELLLAQPCLILLLPAPGINRSCPGQRVSYNRVGEEEQGSYIEAFDM